MVRIPISKSFAFLHKFPARQRFELAQVGNLLYCRLAVGLTSGFGNVCGLPIRDTVSTRRDLHYLGCGGNRAGYFVV
jgi:hypothetical protein